MFNFYQPVLCLFHCAQLISWNRRVM
uniref:Uncharacterized protein n=1 Tax=Arundo donax TaxID=35708 RepID=A0A0A8ZUX1_ARUDO